ncbi:MAG: bifunctional alpha,alpha-trehalose-phosphate synthase (UDP-forming)/trehalose-phosphatase [bacterium]|nr:MAG: bifunctional alpha,alpha-trehalose-phosphate synthase (UDP-forming)/trehalose-phosphatase [bacterium]
MRRMLIVSNRLPISVQKRKGRFNYLPSAGGLATGVSSFYQSYQSLWIGWPGITTSILTEKQEIESKLKSENMYPVFLTKHQIEKYYEGFSNKTIWPLFHYFTQHTIYDKAFWEAYYHVNNIFCDEVLRLAKDDDIIWIHDYQLMLLPGLIRNKLPSATVGFFVHIPFPSFELFRSLPWRKAILNGMLGADLIGFHTYDYVRHFISAVTRLLGIDHTFGNLMLEDRVIKVDSFPMGIDFDKFANASQKSVIKREIGKIRNKIGDHKIILSVDRLDYSKGILQRLKAFDLFMDANPEYRGKLILILLVVPSRSKVEHYRKLKEAVDELVGFINGKYGNLGWTPIWYLYRSLPFNLLSALYNVADIALVTPFRDGMNLIAKEYIASKTDGKGVLILSEVAGAADELGEALAVNPNDIDDIKNALEQAFSISETAQVKQNRGMQERLARYDVNRWAEDFIDTLLKTKANQNKILAKHLNQQEKQSLIADYKNSSHRLILLDYDGTLIGFAKTPEEAKPDNELLTVLNTLTKSPQNEVVIISGRNKDTLQQWFGELNIGLVAEHGAWLRFKGKQWETIEPLKQDWKNEIRTILELYVDRTPGSLVETKDFSIVWHYRKADPGFGEMRARELVDTLVYLTSNLELQVLEGSKVVEVKNMGINKGKAAMQWLTQTKCDFILAIGDDWTDEDLFKVMPENAFSIKVGFTTSVAKFNVKSAKEVRILLNELVQEGTK